MTTATYHVTDDVRPMLSEFLSALGFAAMSREVLHETEWARMQTYARIVLKQTPAAQQQAIRSRFAMLGLV